MFLRIARSDRFPDERSDVPSIVVVELASTTTPTTPATLATLDQISLRSYETTPAKTRNTPHIQTRACIIVLRLKIGVAQSHL
jgi:hypothetical protein